MQLLVVGERQTGRCVTEPTEKPPDLTAGQHVVGRGSGVAPARLGAVDHRCTFPARPSRKARIRLCASPLLPATAAINDSSRYPCSGAASVILGSACSTAKFVTGEFLATFAAKLQRPGQTPTGPDEIVRQAERVTLLGVQHPTGEHHVGHPVRADQPGNPHRAAAADEQSVLAFRQRVEGARLGHPDVGGGREFQTTADHRALEHRDHRQRAVFDPIEHPMPHPGMLQRGERIPLGQFRQVQARREMVAVRVQHDRPDTNRRCREERLQAQDGLVVQRVTFLARQIRSTRDRVLHLDLQGRRQGDPVRSAATGCAAPSCR